MLGAKGCSAVVLHRSLVLPGDKIVQRLFFNDRIGQLKRCCREKTQAKVYPKIR